MNEYKLFPTSLLSIKLDLDLDLLRKDIKEFVLRTPSCQKSNQGGYQGAPYDYKPLSSVIKENTPKSDKEMGDLYIYSWVNINQKDTWNRQHCHMDRVNFLSGVYYVTVPKGDCGEILFHDPRGILSNSAPDTPYYKDNITTATVPPEENMLYYFPTWLEHEVGINNTDEDRVSISFNLMRREDVEVVAHMLRYS